MSAIDRAFIKAYSDEHVATPEQAGSQPRRSSGVAATAAGGVSAPVKPMATTEPPRRTTSRSRRSAAAAAIRADEPAPSAAASPSNPNVDSARLAPSMQAASGVGESQPKMVVGRRALQKLAESAVVPAPHMSFRQAGRAVTQAMDNQDMDKEGNAATAAPQVSGGWNDEQRAHIDVSAADQTRGSDAGPKSQQYRLDPPVATAAIAKQPPHAGVLPMAMQNSTAAPRSSSAARPGSGLRPLSSFRTEQRPAPPSAALEVDRLVWPPACRLLDERAGSELESAAATLAEHLANGSHAIAIVSTDEGEGCTTVVLSIALKLAEQGRRVCLVDGNASHPELAEMVGLEPQRGLESVLAGEAALSEVLIESLEDHLTLLPLCKPLRGDAIERSKLRQTVTFGELRDQFDVVLVDGGCAGSRATRAGILAGGAIDAAILVGRPNGDQIAWERARRTLEQWNVPCLGAIENRCVLETAPL